MEHKVTNGVEYDVLCKDLGNSHGLSLGLYLSGTAIASLILLCSPETSLEAFAKTAHEVTRLLHHLALVFFETLVIVISSSIFFLLDCFLELLVKNFL